MPVAGEAIRHAKSSFRQSSLKRRPMSRAGLRSIEIDIEGARKIAAGNPSRNRADVIAHAAEVNQQRRSFGNFFEKSPDSRTFIDIHTSHLARAR